MIRVVAFHEAFTGVYIDVVVSVLLAAGDALKTAGVPICHRSLPGQRSLVSVTKSGVSKAI